MKNLLNLAKRKQVQKLMGQVKELVKIMFDNLKSGAWSEDDLRDITDAMKENLAQRDERKA